MGNVTIPVGETDALVSAYLRAYFDHQAETHGRSAVTQARLARAIHMSEARMSRRMSGEAAWQNYDLDRIAEFLGVSVAEIVKGPAHGH